MNAPVTRARALQTIGGAVTAAAALSPAAAQAPAALRVGIIPIEPTCEIFYAKENGFFDKAGLDVDVTAGASTPAIAAAVVTGTYDIAYATVSTLAQAHSKGVPFVIIAPSGVINGVAKPVAGIVVAPNSTIASAKDFNGKTFGTTGLNTLAEYLPRAWVDKHGGDSSTMKFVEVPFPQVGEALTAGRIDAGYLVEPFLSLTIKRNAAKWLTDANDAIAPVYLASCWYAMEPWAKAHADVVSRFASAMSEAARWGNANPAKVAPIVVNHLKSDPAVVAATPRTVFADRLVAAQIQPWIDVTAHYAKFATFPAAEILYAAAR